jgi:hypothetical protein
VNSLPRKQELLEFQARWMRPAGILAVSGALLFAVALVLQQTGVGDDDSERLTNFHEHATQLVLAQGVLQGIAVIMFCAPLYVLFRAAQGRAEQVRGPLVAFAFIGPVLFALSSMILTLGLNDVSDKFVEQLPAKERQARAAAQATQTTSETPDQAAEDAGEDLADDLIDDSGTVQTGALLRFPGDPRPDRRPDLHPALGNADRAPHPLLGDAGHGPGCLADPRSVRDPRRGDLVRRDRSDARRHLAWAPAAGLGGGGGDPLAAARG